MEDLVKRDYFESLKWKYHRGSKKQKSQILTEVCELYSCHRKHAIRLLKRRGPGRKSKSQKRGRKQVYDSEFTLVLRRFWRATDRMGSRALKVAIPEWLPSFEHHHGQINAVEKEKLLKVSAATIDRLLHPWKAAFGKGKSGTKPGRLLRNQIPIRTGEWDVTTPGFVEADTVAHCGGSLQGNFVWSLTLTDIATTWTEVRAVWNKGSHGVLTQIQHIEAHLPFLLLGFDCDNGSEFLNYHLLNYFLEDPEKKKRLFTFTRSRPYHKNDNAHVEQKNYTHVRQLLGYERLGFEELVPIINDLFTNEVSLVRNHFYPSFKLKEKKLIETRHRRFYESPVTPYQRVLDSPHVAQEKKLELQALHATLDPIALQKKVQAKLKYIFATLKRLKQGAPPNTAVA